MKKEIADDLSKLLQWLIAITKDEKVEKMAFTFSYKEYCIGLQLYRPNETEAFWMHYHMPYRGELIATKIAETLNLFQNKMI